MQQRNPEEGTEHGIHGVTPFVEQVEEDEVAIALELVAVSSGSTRSARALPLRGAAETSGSVVRH